MDASQQTDRAALRLPPAARAIRGREPSTGAVIGVARLSGCYRDPDSVPLCGPWSEPGRWHLELDDVQELPLPIPARGHLGPLKPTADLVDQVLQQLPDLRP
ncbi:hypothetical protein ACQV4C_31300 [Streptomyces albidoflavus]|uniref:hypothetical protein n=1 Tax=Streptomyces albidoflavus TaxID=1886 RepID=UPI003D1665D8